MAEIAMRFRSTSGATVVISSAAVTSMVDAAKKKPHCETGGILIGHYSDDYTYAWIDEATGEPSGSKSGPTWFIRGRRGLKRILSKFWDEGQFYVGEWHTHPNASPTPSVPDYRSLLKIAQQDKTVCRNPILIIVGGDMLNEPRISVAVATNDGIISNLEPHISAD